MKEIKMSDKCNKYESLFIFSTEEELTKHLESCPDCREEHEKMHKTQNLVKEVKSYYTQKPRIKSNLTKIAAGLTVLFLTYFSITNIMHVENQHDNDISYAAEESIVYQMGLPTDEYGLLRIF